MTTLFGGPAPRIRAIPASAPFLEILVARMIAELRGDDAPFALADAIILVPNRRAAAGMMDEFARQTGAALLPTIRPVGDPDDGPDVWGAEPLAFDIAPAIPELRRRLELATLAAARLKAEEGGADPARALAMADELCRLLDSAAAVNALDWSALPTLVEEMELAAHWRQSVTFLEIVTALWPLRLQEDGLTDPGARRSAVLHALAKSWEEAPPDRPIVIAGSTGSIAATRALMRVVSRLPRGVVVLPGLDSDLDDEAWRAIDAQHPQAALRDTLNALALDRRDVPALCEETEAGRARRVLVREALVPATATADWLRRLDDAGGAKMAAQGLENLALVEAANGEEEAMTIALLMRREMESPAARVALVTADNALAHRVAEKLARWGIVPDVSHARPLRETPHGTLLALLCELARDSGAPVALAGLLNHPLARFGEHGAAKAQLLRHALRGARRHGGVEDIGRLLADIERTAQGRLDLAPARALADLIAEALTPLRDLAQEPTLQAFALALAAAAERIGGDDVWVGRAGAKANAFLGDLRDHGEAFPTHALADSARAVTTLLDGADAPPEFGGDSRCAIWGPLEARLQRRDLIILGGLNEGAWPAPPHEDPFLSRPMRAKLGLAPLETRLGLAAHDFAQLACAPRVVLTRSLKREGAPSVASRWIWRLDTLVRGAGLKLARDDEILALARALDARARRAPLAPPRPAPPKGKRLTQLSVTQVETLIRDPYAIYARKLMGLEALKPVGYEPGAAERGTAIHAALEHARADGSFEQILARLDRALAENGFSSLRRASEKARLVETARAFFAWAHARTGVVHQEVKGKLALRDGRSLTGTADWIELGAEGAAIADFKTGKPPSDKEVAAGLAPQLLLEAAMLARGAFGSDADVVLKARAKELIYFRLGGRDPAPRSVAAEGGVEAAAEAALQELETLLARYAQSDQPFLSKPRVQLIKPWGDYDHLARRKEWADAEEGE